MASIDYEELDDTKKKQATDLFSKREAVDALLADLQTERAAADVIRTQKEQALKTEKNRLTEEIRKLRKASMG